MERYKALMIIIIISGSIGRLALWNVNQAFLYDEAVYLLLGQSLSRDLLDYTLLGSAYAYRPPLLPFLLSFFFRLAGKDTQLVRLLPPFIGICGIAVIFLLGKSLYGEKVGLTAAAMMAFSPLHFEYSLRILTDTGSSLLMTASLLFFYKSYETGSSKQYAFSGMLAGSAVLMRYTTLIIPVIFTAFIAWERKSIWGLFERRYLLSMGSFLSIIAVWSVYTTQWYSRPWGYLSTARRVFALSEPEGIGYLIRSTDVVVTLLSAFLISIGILQLFNWKRNGPSKADKIVALWLFISAAQVFSLHHIEPRYFIMVLPPLSIITAKYLQEIRRKHRRTAHFLLALLLVGCAWVSANDIHRTYQSNVEIKEVALYLKDLTPEGYSIMAGPYPLVQYYSKRKAVSLPSSMERFESFLRENNVLYVVIENYNTPFTPKSLRESGVTFLKEINGISIYKTRNLDS